MLKLFLSMTLEEIMSKLGELSLKGMDFGPERTRSILDKLGSPDKKLKIIHIAGSNGKGTVAEFTSRILKEAGERAGTYTSPEVYGYFSRFEIDCEDISEDLFVKAFGDALSVAGNATRFEVETAAALYAFNLAGCRYAVLECGLGGREDATNAVCDNTVALISSVSLEHTDVLGGDIESICRHKAGIIKNGPAFFGCCIEEPARGILKSYGAEVARTELIKDYRISPDGEVRRGNAALAAAAARALGIGEKAIEAGLEKAPSEGRCEEIFAGGKRYILDGAHNPEAFKPLAELLSSTAEVKEIIYGCLSDKDVDGCLEKLRGLADRITAVKPESPRAMDIKKITAACRRCFDNVCEADGVAGALGRAEAETVVVCGSFTLLKEAKNWIEKKL